MTNEELDQARADEALRISKGKGGILRWMPVDPLMIEAREVAAACWEEVNCPKIARTLRAGKEDDSITIHAVIAALKRGIEIGKEQSK